MGRGTKNSFNTKNPAPWTDKDKNELKQLNPAWVIISDTIYGLFEAQKKRDTVLAH